MTNSAKRVVIVTGAASGIGAATSALLARTDCAVLLVDQSADALADQVEALASDGGTVDGLAIDITSDGAADRIVERAIGRWGALHGLVNNAASFVQRGCDATAEQWRRALGTNVIGPAELIRAAYPLMRARGGGAIVNVGSTSGVGADADYATYNSSKAALIMLTQCLAIDLGSFNIRVNTVSPGITVTPKLRELVALESDDFASWEAAVLNKHCLPRLCQPEDAAQAIAFLLSDAASAITGVNLIVDAGLTVKR